MIIISLIMTAFLSLIEADHRDRDQTLLLDERKWCRHNLASFSSSKRRRFPVHEQINERKYDNARAEISSWMKKWKGSGFIDRSAYLWESLIFPSLWFPKAVTVNRIPIKDFSLSFHFSDPLPDPPKGKIGKIMMNGGSVDQKWKERRWNPDRRWRANDVPASLFLVWRGGSVLQDAHQELAAANKKREIGNVSSSFLTVRNLPSLDLAFNLQHNHDHDLNRLRSCAVG